MKKLATILLPLALVLVAVPVNAQLQSNTTVSLSANIAETLTVTATPGNLSFNNAGTASSAITITTTYNVASGGRNLATVGYFSSTTALSASGGTIPTFLVFGSMNGGTPVACTGTADLGPLQPTNACPRFAGNTGGTTGVPTSGTHTDSLLLSIPAIGAGNQIAPGAYTGVLNIVAEIW